MSQSDQVDNGGIRLLKAVTTVALVIACFENVYLMLVGFAAAGFVGILIILVPTSVGLAYLLFLWLRLRLADAAWARLLAAIAASTWPWAELLSMGHLNYPWSEMRGFGFVVPYFLLAVVGFKNRHQSSFTPPTSTRGRRGLREVVRKIPALWIPTVLSVLVAIGGYWSTRPGGLTNSHLIRYLIPSGYVGWVQVQYGIPTAPPLPREDGGQLIRVPPSGVVQTSDKQVMDWASDEYYYVSGSHRQLLNSSRVRGSGSMIWGHFTNILALTTRGSKQSKTHPFTGDFTFFVGTEASFEKAHPLIP
jgi:hypothetical protein